MQNKINFTAFKFIITMQWHRNQIERGGGARHIRIFYKNDNVEIVG